MAGQRWKIRLGAEAERDFEQILRWTAESFGAGQAKLYRDILIQALTALADGPAPPGSRPRDEIAPGLRVLHVGRYGRRGRHFLLYRVAEDQTIEIGRILHDSMDLRRHVPDAVQDDEKAP